jgi:hypothetical protein
VTELDPKFYVDGRLITVNYPVLIHQTTPPILRPKEGQSYGNSELHPVAVASFGDIKHQFGWHTRASAWNLAHIARANPNYVLPSASDIAKMFQCKGGGPTVERIQRVLSANEDADENNASREKWEALNCVKGACHKPGLRETTRRAQLSV